MKNKWIIRIFFVLLTINVNAEEKTLVTEAQCFCYYHSPYSSIFSKEKHLFNDSNDTIKTSSYSPNINPNYEQYFSNWELVSNSVEYESCAFDLLLLLKTNNIIDTIGVDINEETVYFKQNKHRLNMDFFMKFAAVIPRFVFDDYVAFKSKCPGF